MAVNPLDPTKPTGANQVELSAELRAIKGRLVADKAATENLDSQIVPLVDAGATGLNLLADETVDDAFSSLAVTAVGQQLIQDFADVPAIQAFLGIVAGDVESVVNTINNGTITWAGGVKLKWVIQTVAGGGSYVPFTWDTPFPTICFFGGVFGYGGDQAAWLQGAPTVTGGNVDHNNSSSRVLAIFGIGK